MQRADLMTAPLAERPSNRWATRIVLVLFGAVVIPAGVSILYTYAPTDEQNSFYPGCLFKWITGLNCPGCGATRCCHALLHLEFEQAFAWNPLFVILLPFLTIGAAQVAYGSWIGKTVRGYRLPIWTAKLALWTMLAYWIMRNLPVYPFTLLAPHAI